MKFHIALSFTLAAMGCSKDKKSDNPTPDPKTSSNTKMVDTPDVPGTGDTTTTEAPMFTISVECSDDAKFISRNVAVGTKEVVPDNVSGFKVYKPGETTPFATIKSKEQVPGASADHWQFELDDCKSYSGIVTTQPIPALGTATTKESAVDDALAAIIKDEWKTATDTEFVPAKSQRKTYELSAANLPCDSIEQITGPKGEESQPYAIFCIKGGAIQSLVRGAHWTGDEEMGESSGIEIKGAADINGDGNAELLLQDWYYEGFGIYWLDMTKKEPTRYVISEDGA